jgi:hypothetical protein
VATDLPAIVERLLAFHDLADLTIVSVGAGGGQLVEYARPARHVIAVDPDGPACDRLSARLAALDLADRFTLLRDDFLAVRPRGDLVLFEFSLHAMRDPERALAHASRLAPATIVMDHAPGSQWMWCAAEEPGVAAAWTAVARRPVRRSLDVPAVQRFSDFAELETRLVEQPPPSRERIVPFEGRADISIDMPYRLALI